MPIIQAYNREYKQIHQTKNHTFGNKRKLTTQIDKIKN